MKPALLLATLATALLVACGGGGGGSAGGTSTPPPDTTGSFVDDAPYATAATGSLSGATEGGSRVRGSLTIGGTPISWTAQAGHLIAREGGSAAGRAQASMFHASYVRDDAGAGAAAARPVTFFFNGGPGSATIWLHLGSWAPKRLDTRVPATTTTRPFALVDNPDSLLDATDLVFVDAVGTGLSTAIAPFSNRDFWGVDADAALMRDFMLRWLAANQREASPVFVYGESYGGPRAAVLAPLLQRAGVKLAGIVLHAPALDYNSNCAIVPGIGKGCGGYLPSYGAIAAFHNRVTPAPASIESFLADLRSFTEQRYAPAVSGWFGGSSLPADLPALLAGSTGIGADTWRTQPNLGPDFYRRNLLAAHILGRYDGRIAAANGSPLAAQDDPSSTLITDSFVAAIATHLRETLRYQHSATYVLLSNAIQSWNFSHAGRQLPDTVPDLATALAADAALKLFVVSGWHDLATPAHQTELDVARLASPSRVTVRNYAGGHMTYLDDGSRAAQRADLAAFIRGQARALEVRKAPLAALRGEGGAGLPSIDSAGVPPTAAAVPEPAIQAPMRDPWVPPRR